MLPRPFRRRDRLSSLFPGGGILDEFFAGLQQDLLGDGLGRLGSTDIYQKDGSIHYELELPGMEKADINLQACGDRLVVSGEVNQEESEEGVNYISRGRRHGKFQRTLPLPEEVEYPDALKADFKDGILHIEAKLSKPVTEDEYFDVEIE